MVVLLFSLVLLLASTATSTIVGPPAPASDDRDIDGWCSTVPHPGPCKLFIPSSSSSSLIHKSEFRRLVVEAALKRAKEAQVRTWKWGTSNCKNAKERAAWDDCVKLYDYTVNQLNLTLTGLNSSSCSVSDAQTWLSAALTNLETCILSSSDFNVTGFMVPHVNYNNVSELISNTLAVNNNNNNNTNYKSNDLPATNWLSKRERRLLFSRRSMAAKLQLADFVVAKDGSGRFSTVQSAINAAAKANIINNGKRKIIYVKKGVYRENIFISFDTNNIMLIGDGMKRTVITGRRSTTSGYTTYNAPTVAVDGSRFIARGITFRNTAGPNAGQAPAFRSSSDLSAYYQCAFEAYQDTLFVHSQRQFYKQCYIYGTIDIIFGNAAAVFQNCMIMVRKPWPGQANVITAQGRLDPNQNTGIVLQNCVVMPNRDLRPVVGKVDTFLGRPWKPYSRTVIIKSYLDSLVAKSGWLNMYGQGSLKTIFLAEYRNIGPGSRVNRRVRWPGFHALWRANQVSPFTVTNFISGRQWLPDTGVPFRAGI